MTDRWLSHKPGPKESPEPSHIAADGSMSPAEIRGRPVLVLGLAVSGRAVARVLSAAGATVYASESERELHSHPEVEQLREAGVQIEIGSHRKAQRWLEQVDFVIPSPGISPRAGILSQAIASGVPVLSEIELGSRFAQAPVVAVTGTNGKTTTSQMIGDILSRDGRKTVVCGNIGVPFISAAMESPDAGVFVVEVSSFQLTFCYAFHPVVAVITNLAPDHLDWHGTLEGYEKAKSRIASRQTRNDWFVYPAAQPELAALAPSPGPRKIPFSLGVLPSGDGVWLDRGQVAARIASDLVERYGSAGPIASHGRPIVEDALAATAAGIAFGAGQDAIGHMLATFTPDHHRIEPVGSMQDVSFVDDSKATNPHATLAALKGFDNVVLIAGGRNKGLDLSGLRSECSRLRGLVALGEAGPEVLRALEGTGVLTAAAHDMQEAVEQAFRIAHPGDVVLLSPACASLDQFEDYAARGRAFQQAARDLARSKGADFREPGARAS